MANNQTLNMNENLFLNETELLLILSPEGYIIVAVILFLIGFIGFFFNLGVILLMWKDQQLWTPLNTVLFNLVCCDFSVSVIGNPWAMISAIFNRWIFGGFICKIYAFFMALLGITSITTLTVLSFERYIIVSQPFKNTSLTRKGAIFSIFGIWIYSSILTVPPFFGWGNYVSESVHISCSVNWEEQSYNAMTYIIFLFVFGLALPLAIIAFSYTNIIKTMKQSRIRSGQVYKAERRITLMILIMIIAFLIAWGPYAVMALLIQFQGSEALNPVTTLIPALVAKSSICYNPIIYVGMNGQFRQSWRQIFNVNERNNEGSRNLTKTTQNATECFEIK